MSGPEPFTKITYDRAVRSFYAQAFLEMPVEMESLFRQHFFIAATRTRAEYEAQVPEDLRMGRGPTIAMYSHWLHLQTDHLAVFEPVISVARRNAITESYLEHCVRPFDAHRRRIWGLLNVASNGWMDPALYLELTAQHSVEFEELARTFNVFGFIRLLKEHCEAASAHALTDSLQRMYEQDIDLAQAFPWNHFVTQFLIHRDAAMRAGINVNEAARRNEIGRHVQGKARSYGDGFFQDLLLRLDHDALRGTPWPPYENALTMFAAEETRILQTTPSLKPQPPPTADTSAEAHAAYTRGFKAPKQESSSLLESNLSATARRYIVVADVVDGTPTIQSIQHFAGRGGRGGGRGRVITAPNSRIALPAPAASAASSDASALTVQCLSAETCEPRDDPLLNPQVMGPMILNFLNRHM